MVENNFLEKRAFRKKSSEKEMLQVIRNNAEELMNYTDEIVSKASKEEYEIVINLMYSEVKSRCNEVIRYLNERYMEIESLEEEIGALKERLADKENKDREELKNLKDRMNTFMELVEENVKTIAVSKKIKKVHGKEKDSRIPDEEVIKLYKRGLSTQKIADYYNNKYGGIIVTANGIRNRLINLGVYEGRRL